MLRNGSHVQEDTKVLSQGTTPAAELTYWLMPNECEMDAEPDELNVLVMPMMTIDLADDPKLTDV